MGRLSIEICCVSNSGLWKTKLTRKFKHMRAKLVNEDILEKRRKFGGKRKTLEREEERESPTKKKKVRLKLKIKRFITVTELFMPYPV